jgi:hypothetical protein
MTAEEPMIISPALFSSETDEWATPLWLFRKLNQRGCVANVGWN